MKKFLALTLTALLIISCLAGCNNGGGTPSGDQSSSKVLRIGMECDYPPFNWTQLDDSNDAVKLADGTYAGGYDVQIAQRIAEELDMELEIVKTQWDGLIPSLTSGKIDLVIAGMTDNAERRLSIDFTGEYYISDLVLVVRGDSEWANAASIADFSGARVTGQLGTIHYAVIDQIDGVQKMDAMDTFPTMVTALNSGRIDAYVSERPGAMSAQISNPDLTYVSFEGDSGFVYDTEEVSVSIGVSKSNTDLKDQVDAVLEGITDADRQTYMENALRNQPLAAE